MSPDIGWFEIILIFVVFHIRMRIFEWRYGWPPISSLWKDLDLTDSDKKQVQSTLENQGFDSIIPMVMFFAFGFPAFLMLFLLLPSFYFRFIVFLVFMETFVAITKRHLVMQKRVLHDAIKLVRSKVCH